MKLQLLFLVVLAITVNCRPLDDDNPAQEGDDKRDKIDDTPKTDDDAAAKPADDSAALSDSPITDPTADKSSGDEESGSKRAVTTNAPTTDSTTPEVTKPVTTKPDDTTTISTTTTPPSGSTTETPITTAVPEGEGETVKGSENNTLTMKATTYHVAIEDESIEFYPEINHLDDIHRHNFQSLIGGIYHDDPEYKQTVIIKFSKPGSPNDDAAEVRSAGTGVVVDFYLRFYNPGTHLKKLTDVLKTGRLQSHKVKKLFVRAYIAEPTGRVCTPDCKVQCYSYCDAGCCHINIVQNVELPTPGPVDQLIEQQQQLLKTGAVTEKCEGPQCQQPMMQMMQQQPPMMMMMPQPQMPCQGASCAPPMMPPQMPCQGASCAPPQMPCQGASCAPPMMMMPPPQMPCQTPPCAPPMMPPQMPCQGASCAPQMPKPCQGVSCAPPPQMPCQGASCAPPMMPPQLPCQGASCAPPPMMMMAPMPQMNMCPPSCGQVCAPSCPNQCCGMQPPMMQQAPMFAPPARCGPKGC